MHNIVVAAIVFYLLGTAAYAAFLFIQRNVLQTVGFGFLAAGFLCQSVSIGWVFVSTGHVPANNLHETLAIVAWSLVGVYLALYLKYRLKALGVYTAPLATFILIMAVQFPREPLQPVNVLKGFWLLVHIITIFLGDAAFLLAGGAGMLYLLQERGIKQKKRGFFYKRLPSLELLDTAGYACIVIGFTLLTVGLISGMIYAKSFWGRFWAWDPKEVWSAITWIFYAILLHERLTVGWRGRRAALMAIAGCMVLLFTFLGVNFLLTGHHGQFTRY